VQARSAVPFAVKLLPEFQVDGTWNVPTYYFDFKTVTLRDGSVFSSVSQLFRTESNRKGANHATKTVSDKLILGGWWSYGMRLGELILCIVATLLGEHIGALLGAFVRRTPPNQRRPQTN